MAAHTFIGFLGLLSSAVIPPVTHSPVLLSSQSTFLSETKLLTTPALIQPPRNIAQSNNINEKQKSKTYLRTQPYQSKPTPKIYLPPSKKTPKPTPKIYLPPSKKTPNTTPKIYLPPSKKTPKPTPKIYLPPSKKTPNTTPKIYLPPTKKTPNTTPKIYLPPTKKTPNTTPKIYLPPTKKTPNTTPKIYLPPTKKTPNTTPKIYLPPTKKTPNTTPKIYLPSDLDSTNVRPKSKGNKKKFRYLTMQKPILRCRGFKNKKTNRQVSGFRFRLYGRNINAVAAKLRSRLSSYQASGGNLSRCQYSAFLKPSLFDKYMGGRLPNSAIRSRDKYSLSIYPGYRSFLKANKGRAAKFGLFATSLPLKSSKGSNSLLRVTANNALILFVDARNSSTFKFMPANILVRYVNVARPIREVLSESAKPSLKRIIRYKKLRRLRLEKLTRSFSERFMLGQSQNYLIASRSNHTTPLTTSFTNSIVDKERLEHPQVNPAYFPGEILISQISPANYCQFHSEFYGAICDDLSSQDVSQLEDCDSIYSGQSRKLGLCQTLFNEIGEIQGGNVDDNTTANDNEETTDEWCADDPDLCEEGSNDDNEETTDEWCADDPDLCEEGSNDDNEETADEWCADDPDLCEEDSSDDNEETTDELCVDDPELCEGESEGEFCDEDDCYDDNDNPNMFDDDMGAPTASTCQGSTFGEQLLCALLNALTTLLQDAFSSN
ncbi:hypothetical protein PMIT1342_02109 [Prochlorococcus marinus str. MIT 1342]|uniref:hypothetical protein n=1 Tax=Prochlorococcus TaxID=1218 RepID=UPI0007BBA49D|nr:hypothetical protein [Prochlorococcus marinus]KZR80162.1 hypothetical protein PMIT1342_02109 [Prochlorococcus marinus str. MIT 1342]